MKKNTFVEASERYQDFKSRGLIPEGEKYVYRDFVKEVASERKNGKFVGRYTAKAYSQKYGLKITYFSGETISDIVDRYLEKMLEYYKAELLDIFDKNDFLIMIEKYGKSEFNFDVYEVFSAEDLDSLVRVAKRARKLQPYLFRNVKGRNRRTESSMIDNYFDEFDLDLRRFINEVETFIAEHEL